MARLFQGTSGHYLRHWPPRQMSAPFSSSAKASPLAQLRQLMAKHNIGYYLVLSQDEHNSEYVAEADQRRAFISGFTGSAGVAIIGLHTAELSTDGRYFLQAEKQLSSDWTLRKEGTGSTLRWFKAVAEHAKKDGTNIGVDPRFIDAGTVETIEKELAAGAGAGSAKLVPIRENLVDAVWKNKPKLPSDPAVALPDSVTGQSSSSKLADLRKTLKERDVKGILLFALDQNMWLFNLRGNDVDYNPVFKSFALITDTSVRLYVDPAKVEHIKCRLAGVEVRPYGSIFDDAKKLAASVSEPASEPLSEKPKQKPATSPKLWLPKGASWELVTVLGGPDNLIDEVSPVEVAKSVKNSIELDGQRLAQVKCGLSIVRYFAYLSRELAKGNTGITEYEGSTKLLALRKELEFFRELSFETISSVGPNAAIIHYAPKKDGKHTITDKQVYLLDSGSQFTHGTTDTTRTVHFGQPTAEEIHAYTLVLKGHIALARAVFPQGTNGYQLDVLARQYLWSQGLDYLHGTGHGVGAYLNVHEGPMGIGNSIALANQPLREGNVISNEPGFYEDNKFGIRIESLVVVKPAKTAHNFAKRKFFEFETVTRVPLAPNLIDESLLDEQEREWVNSYHQKVEQDLLPHLSEEDAAWLKKQTKQL